MCWSFSEPGGWVSIEVDHEQFSRLWDIAKKAESEESLGASSEERMADPVAWSNRVREDLYRELSTILGETIPAERGVRLVVRPGP